MNQSADWQLREARESDEPALVDLLRLGLGDGTVPRTSAFWRWKHRANPFGSSPVLVAEAAGGLVGVRAFLRWSWQRGDEAVPAVRAVDTVTHPEWRGRGLFSTLTRELVERVAAEGAAFVFNTPNAKSGPGYRKLGWSRVGRLPLYVKPLRAKAVPAALAARFAGRRGSEPGTAEAATADDEAVLAADSTGGADEVFPKPVGAFLDRPGTAALLAAAATSGETSRYRTLPTADYLRWRYADAPGLAYRVLADPGGEAALILRGRRRHGLAEVSMSEMLTVPGAAGVAAAVRLLHRLKRATTADYAAAIASPGTLEHTVLRRAGFLRAPGVGPAFFVRPLSAAPAAPPLTAPASWRFTTGACELF